MADSSSLDRRPPASIVVGPSPHQLIIKCSCGIALKVKAELAGKKVKCPGCGAIVAAPRPEVAEQKAIAAQTGPPAESDDTRTLPPQHIPDNGSVPEK